MYIYTSIIIPHRGPQELLDKCVASIPKRDDVEIIVVIDEHGRGAGWARNKGLEQAEGKYIIFADSDDFFLPCFNCLLDAIKQEDADMFFFNAKSIDIKKGKPSWRANHLNRIFHDTNKKRQEKHLRYYFTEPWCRAIKRSLIEDRNIKFSESLKLNDILFASKVGYYAKTIKVYNEKCYCIGNQSSSAAKRIDFIRELHVVREAALATAFLREKGVDHIYSRMMRPTVKGLLQGKFSQVSRYWKEMRNAGLSNSFLMYCLLRYPRDLTKLLIKKIQSGEII